MFSSKLCRRSARECRLRDAVLRRILLLRSTV